MGEALRRMWGVKFDRCSGNFWRPWNFVKFANSRTKVQCSELYGSELEKVWCSPPMLVCYGYCEGWIALYVYSFIILRCSFYYSPCVYSVIMLVQGFLYYICIVLCTRTGFLVLNMHNFIVLVQSFLC